MALMALWFMGSWGWGALDWWGRGQRGVFWAATAIAMVFGCQLLLQRRAQALLARLPPPGAGGFFGGALLGLALYAGTHLALFPLAGPGPGVGAAPLRWVASEAVLLLPWYAAWWGILRRGWQSVPAVLIASGIQRAVMTWALIVRFPARGWLWMAPIQFFAGWCLMFLPGAAAAHFVAPPAVPVHPARRLVAWAAPPLAGLAAARGFAEMLR